MPYLDLKVTDHCLPETIDRLAHRMTELVVDVLHKKAELVAATVQCVPSARWHVAGTALANGGRAGFFAEVVVTEGSNTSGEKADFISAAFSSAEGILGPLDAASYVVIRDIRADSWGYQGRTQAFRRDHPIISAL